MADGLVKDIMGHQKEVNDVKVITAFVAVFVISTLAFLIFLLVIVAPIWPIFMAFVVFNIGGMEVDKNMQGIRLNVFLIAVAFVLALLINGFLTFGEALKSDTYNEGNLIVGGLLSLILILRWMFKTNSGDKQVFKDKHRYLGVMVMIALIVLSLVMVTRGFVLLLGNEGEEAVPVGVPAKQE